jgi:hypothetical protein
MGNYVPGGRPGGVSTLHGRHRTGSSVPEACYVAAKRDLGEASSSGWPTSINLTANALTTEQSLSGSESGVFGFSIDRSLPG